MHYLKSNITEFGIETESVKVVQYLSKTFLQVFKPTTRTVIRFRKYVTSQLKDLTSQHKKYGRLTSQHIYLTRTGSNVPP